ncbi:metallophosphoesterase [Novosphingobium lentum]|uniref:metallophosphoesterase n=1 Tax=Novosphingobium lentum TaxID=145287 RepID=UPI00146FEBD2|nr:metallophosphoesterase [Novosphingobium lentum]
MAGKRTIAAVGLIVLAVSACAWWIGRREAQAIPVVVRYAVAPLAGQCPPQALRIAVVSDLHVSPRTTPPATIAAMVDTIDRQQPDLVLLAGDYLAPSYRDDPIDLSVAFAPLARLHPRLGTVAVLGNNDWIRDRVAIGAALERVGITVLHNDAMVTPEVAVLGTEELISNTANPVLADERYRTKLAEGHLPPPARRIWLAHQPAMFDRMGTTGDLLVTGHTHGGQFLPWLSLPLGRVYMRAAAALGFRGGWPAESYVRGLYRHGTKRMLVTSGVGTSGPPVRLGVPPEIAVIDMPACQGGAPSR